MKRIAEELGCATMTLYYYVRTKADIVTLMHDAILAEIILPDEDLPADWLKAVAAIARRTRDVLLAHPWSLASLNEAQFGPNAMRHMEQSLAALDALDLDTAEKLSLWGVIDDYVFGNALHTIELLARAAEAKRDPTVVADAFAFGKQQIATGQFPRLASLEQKQFAADQTTHNNWTTPESAAPLTAQFERGLNLLLEGLAASAAPAGTGVRPGMRKVRRRSK